jgi:dipeptidyl aminopeptidase/acylaminoacyl peptidase
MALPSLLAPLLLAAGPLTIESLVAIRHPTSAAWSPDGTRVALVWEQSGVENVYVAPAEGGEPRPLTRHLSGLVPAMFWGADGAHVYFEREGDLWRVPAAGGDPARVWETREGESGVALAHDGRRVAFARGGDLYVRDLQDGREVRLTETKEAEGGPAWSPDDRRLAFEIATFTPHENVPDYAGGKIAFRSQKDYRSAVGIVAATGGPVTRVARGDGWHSTPRWLDRERITLQRDSPDVKVREVLVADAAGTDVRVLFRDEDPKFWSLTFLGAEPLPSPDGRHVAFLSDRDGWDHVYVVPADGGSARQVTRGRFEASGLAWSPDGRRLAFDANRGGNPGVRELLVADVSAGDGALTTVAGGRGTSTRAQWDPSGRRLLYQHTDPQTSADLFVVEAREGAAARRLTTSLPDSVDRSLLIEPQLVRYSSRDGQSVPAWLFVPRGLDRTRRHPAIVWVHGDGITQNFDGWHTRRDYAVYYSFHQYLAQRGYVVLAVDYRGSIGYGRDWRQGHYRDLGGKDYEDIAAAVPYLDSLGYVDTSRAGIWGLSYGGFMALQALTVTPDLFRCAIDVAGVHDWRHWYADPGGPWILGRMGRPEENAALYDRLSPVHQVGRISRPLLVLHGTADVNVPFLESVRLLDAALKAGKDVEFMMYPGEYHYFQRAHVLRDAWARVERFFDRHLRPARD